jgi:dihydropteroate synthase
MNKLKIGNKIFDLDKKTLLMGILNVTTDSFSDGGHFLKFDDAVKHAIQMQKEGADMIDIGGESTRPGSEPINIKTEVERVIPLIEQLSDELSIPISIDTYKADVAEKAINAGASLVNDITALQGDSRLVNVIAENNVPICLMHMKGNPKTMQINPVYDDIINDIKLFLKERTEYAKFNDITDDKIIIDPGLGFGKRTGRGVEDNCVILKRLTELKELGYPILIGASRKTFIGNICGNNQTLPVNDRLQGSLAAACIAVINGANILRVHDVMQTKRCVDFVECVLKN